MDNSLTIYVLPLREQETTQKYINIFDKDINGTIAPKLIEFGVHKAALNEREINFSVSINTKSRGERKQAPRDECQMLMLMFSYQDFHKFWVVYIHPWMLT